MRAGALVVVLSIGVVVAAWVALRIALPGSPARRPFGGFEEVAFRIEPGRRGCALLATRQDQWARGLMGRQDLGGYDAMVFDFGTEVTSGFWMRNTPIALTVAFFAADGRYVGARDMAPCGDRPDCPVYRAPRPYRYAIEVPQGRLARLGARPGSRLVLRGPC